MTGMRIPVTHGHLLDGQVKYAQPRDGFRTGIEPVLLAAAVPARAGDLVLEAGTGAGAALLCLAARVAGVFGLGLEIDPELALIAAGNAASNHFDGTRFAVADVERPPLTGGVDHVFANPPYHPENGTRSPNRSRDTAKRADDGLVGRWAMAMAAVLRPRGTLTVILPCGKITECLGAMAAGGCACDAIVPLWPMAGRAAKLLLIQGIKSGRAATRLLPGLTLHAANGTYTPEADAILRSHAPLIPR